MSLSLYFKAPYYYIENFFVIKLRVSIDVKYIRAVERVPVIFEINMHVQL